MFIAGVYLISLLFSIRIFKSFLSILTSEKSILVWFLLPFSAGFKSISPNFILFSFFSEDINKSKFILFFIFSVSFILRIITEKSPSSKIIL